MKYFRFVSYHLFFLMFVVPVMIAAYPLSVVGQVLQAIASGLSGGLKEHVLGVPEMTSDQHAAMERELAKFLAEQQPQPPTEGEDSNEEL